MVHGAELPAVCETPLRSLRSCRCTSAEVPSGSGSCGSCFGPLRMQERPVKLQVEAILFRLGSWFLSPTPSGSIFQIITPCSRCFARGGFPMWNPTNCCGCGARDTPSAGFRQVHVKEELRQSPLERAQRRRGEEALAWKRRGDGKGKRSGGETLKHRPEIP